MSYTVQYKQDTNCIQVAVEGEFNLTVLQNIAADVNKLIKQHGCICIINDLRRAQLADGTMNIYDMPKSATQAGVPGACRRALIVNDLTDFRFIETVFRNQGHRVKMFTDIEEAKQWLWED